ncbi:hypothetical protein H4582DRAFT_59091 [Lactarius indigo]|nr:hypothetical protein H4582DRAFT_59091 [Lactarius indigo]
MAQQLATGRQQHHQRQFLPAVPQVTHGRQPLPAQQPATSSSRNVQIFNHGRSHNEPNLGDVMSQNARHYRFHAAEQSRAPVPSVQQQQQHYTSSNSSTPLVNQSVHPQRNTNHIHPIGRVGTVATSALNTFPPIAQPPKATVLASVQHQSQYPQYSGMATTGLQARVGQGSTSRMVPSQGGHSYEQISTLYHSWVKTHGPEKAGEMTQDLMRSWQQKGQIPSVQTPMHSTTASSTALTSARSHQMQSQFQIPNHSVPNEGVSAPPQPHVSRQEWISGITEDGRLVPSPSPLHLAVLSDNSAPQTSVSQGIVGPQEPPITGVSKEEETDHSVTTASFPSTFPTCTKFTITLNIVSPRRKVHYSIYHAWPCG